VTAATLAKPQADIQMLQSQIDLDGYIIEGKINTWSERHSACITRSP